MSRRKRTQTDSSGGSSKQIKADDDHQASIVNCKYLYPTTSRISLLLHEYKVKQRTSVNNNDILQVQWDITCLYPKGLSQSVLLCGITGNGF